MQTTLKVGIVGTGGAADSHYNVLQNINPIQVVSVLGRHKQKLNAKSLEWQVKAYETISQMVGNEKLDVVLIANQNHLHNDDAL